MAEGTRRNGGRGPTIRDVAALAGVSVTTVSRYLNDQPYISAEKAECIRAAMQRLGYRPSAVAQAFSRGTSRSVVVAASGLELYGPVRTLSGIERAATKAGYAVGILIAGNEQTLGRLTGELETQRPAGVIAIAYDDPGISALARLPASIPHVAICGGGIDGASRQVSIATYEAGRTVTELLLSLGHSTVHHVAVPAREAGPGRTRGWLDALHAHGCKVADPIEVGWDPQDAYEAGRLLANDPDCTAVFAGNDETAMGIIAGLASIGRRVPEDVSVAGMDGHPLGAVCQPPLTTFRLGFERAGAAAFSMLVSDGAATSLEVAGSLEIRESTAPPAA